MYQYNGVYCLPQLQQELEEHKAEYFAKGIYSSDVWSSYNAALNGYLGAYMRCSLMSELLMNGEVFDDIEYECLCKTLAIFEVWARIFKKQLVKAELSIIRPTYEYDAQINYTALAEEQLSVFKNTSDVKARLDAYELARWYRHLATKKNVNI